MQITFKRQDNGKPASFTLERALPAGCIGADARGLRLMLGTPLGGEWWMRLSVHAGGKYYGYTMQTAYPDRAMVEQDIPFDRVQSRRYAA